LPVLRGLAMYGYSKRATPNYRESEGANLCLAALSENLRISEVF
jgi:hypothetical protein